MPIPLDLQEEEYAATGGIGGEGVRKALGRPEMGVLTLVAREALQNSWDARVSPQGLVKFMIQGWTLKKSELRAARELVFDELPEGLPLKHVLARDTVDVLCISDRGTRGLVGPTRADRLDINDPNRNFVAFIRDVGRAASAQIDGGTYGYGKASFYQASRAGTICVFTRIKDERGRTEDRFIAAGLGNQHNATTGRNTVRRTGRCWWGRRGTEGVVDPVTGPDAKHLAVALGMPEFEDGQTGTSVLVIAPDVSVDSDGEAKERSITQAVTRLVSDLVWFAWPKMVPGRTGLVPISFEASVRQGDRVQRIPFPDPITFPPVASFVQAYRRALRSMQDRRMADGNCTPIKRYAEIIGWLALENFGVHARQALDTGDPESAAWVGSPCHHVALMRGPRLIVRYVQGTPLATDVLEYAGVFISMEQVEEAFAAAEPPTHDDWRPETLADPLHRSYVRVALQKIKEEMSRFAGVLSAPAPGAGGLQPLGGFAQKLGELLTQVEGTGRPDVPPRPPLVRPLGGGGGGRVRRANVRPTGDVEYEMDGERRIAIVSFQVSPLPGTHNTKVRARPRVAVDDGDQAENDPPVGAELPEVLGWLTPHGERLDETTDLAQIPVYELGVWKVRISVPEDALITVDLSAE